jgi:hypothetical protein
MQMVGAFARRETRSRFGGECAEAAQGGRPENAD